MFASLQVCKCASDLQTCKPANLRFTALWIVIPILALSIGGHLISSHIANRRQKEKGQPTIDGAFGGAICPKCDKPFAMHIWGFKVVVGKFDRCPHCGKWSLVRRAHPDALQQAAETMLGEETAAPHTPSLTPEEELRKKLDDSRFDS